MDNPILVKYLTVTIFCSMLAIGVNHSFSQLTSLWRQPVLLLRSIVAVVVLVPILVAFLLRVLDPPIAVANSLAVLAAAPGAPLMTKRSLMAGGDSTYSASLQLTLALIAVIVTPFTLAVFYSMFEFPTARVTPLEVAYQVVEVTFLPVIVGLLLQRFAPKLTERIVKPVRLIANVLLILLIVVLVVLFAITPDLRAMLMMGRLTIMTMAIVVVGALAMGHVLGGPSRAQRSSLAIATIARNAGLAMFIAALCDYGTPFFPTLLAYLIVGALFATPYSIWRKRQITQRTQT